MEKKLSEISVGSTCKIKKLNLGEEQRQRLLDLGVLPGTKIKLLQKSPLGDPAAYFVRGTVVALRNENTEKIFVEI